MLHRIEFSAAEFAFNSPPRSPKRPEPRGGEFLQKVFRDFFSDLFPVDADRKGIAPSHLFMTEFWKIVKIAADPVPDKESSVNQGGAGF
jgi:hypothetical protein